MSHVQIQHDYKNIVCIYIYTINIYVCVCAFHLYTVYIYNMQVYVNVPIHMRLRLPTAISALWPPAFADCALQRPETAFAIQ